MTLRISLGGPLRLSWGGTPMVAPTPMPRLLLLALALAPDLRMPRDEVSGLLWSTRGPEQANDSLRQTLTALRTALGHARGVLVGGAGWVGLDQGMVEIAMPGPGEVLCEGLEPRDPKAADWLARLRRDQPWSRGRTGPLRIAAEGAGAGGAALSEGIRQAGALYPVFLMPAGGDADLHAAAATYDSGLIELRLADWSGAPLWSELVPQDEMRGVAGRLAAAILTRAPHALTDVFAYDPARLRGAEARLGAFDDPVSLALRAYTHLTRGIERIDGDRAAHEERAEDLLAQAAASGRPDATVMAMQAMAAGQVGALSVALEIVDMALRLDPRNPFALWARGGASLMAGRVADALADAEAARDTPLAALAPATATMRVAGATLLTGDLDRSRGLLQATSVLAPDYRPPMRFLVALEARRADEAALQRTVDRLRRLEPDFHPGLLKDPAYPAASLRRAGLID